MNENGNLPSHALFFDNWLGSQVSENTSFLNFSEECPVLIQMEIHFSTARLIIMQKQSPQRTLFTSNIPSDSVCRMFPTKFILTKKEENVAFYLRCDSEIEANRLNCALEAAQSQTREGCWFDKKTEKSSSDLYFHYYGTLQHQQNMLQDCVRTGTYYMAFVNNTIDFRNNVVMDVGAGSGMLSLFASQAGARKVYAVEASPMARYAQRLAKRNPVCGSNVEVIESKIEELELNEKVDVLISEPIGTLLVNERMLETYIFARDHFLKPGGKMFPSMGRIHIAAFSDDVLYQEVLSKATFWLQKNFYGVDLSSLHADALNQYFTQVVVDAFDPLVLVSNVAIHSVDFTSIAEEELYDLQIPLDYTITRPCTVNGVACWFDLFFDGTSKHTTLTTAPGSATTHWFQLRCVLPQPLSAVNGSRMSGSLRLKAHTKQSYTLTLILEVFPLAPGIQHQRVEYCYDLKEPYYRQLMNCWQTPSPPAHCVGDGMYGDTQMY